MLKNVFLMAFALFMGLAFMPEPAKAEPAGVPGEGCLRVVGGDKEVLCPLEHTSVSADLSGFTGKVTVVQKFRNDSKEPIEAEYIFPLPDMAAVDSMTMKIGDKRIRAEIKKKEEAKKIYEDAKESGRRAALLDQQRTNIFTQRVANVMPGDKIEIVITYVETIPCKDGVYEFVFPMVVGPRYIPSDSRLSDRPVSRDEAVRISNEQASTGWGIDESRVKKSKEINPPIVPEGMRAGHDISVDVSLTTPVSIKDLKSVLHKVDVEKIDPCRRRIALSKSDAIPNKDFILRYSLEGNKIEEGLICHFDKEKKGFFSLFVQPPARPSVSQILPKEMIFVVDTSGSQMGRPIEKAKETMNVCIDGMNPDDTFNIICFSNKVEKLFDSPVKNTRENRDKAHKFMDSVMGRGGTEMKAPIEMALNAPADPNRLRIVTVMTDGYIGNDREMIDLVRRNLGRARVFTFGTGNSVNRFLIDKMAEAGRGEAEIVTLNSSGSDAAKSFFKKIACPLMTDVKADWGSLPVSGVSPENQPDLFSGKPIVFTGRYSKEAKGVLTITGNSAGRPFTKKIDVAFPAVEPLNSSLPALWARKRIDSISSGIGYMKGAETSKAAEQITELGLQFNLVTDYTSFVAVEDKVVNKDGKSVTVSVPVEMPDGVDYKGVFGDDQEMVDMMPARNSSAMGGAFKGTARTRMPAMRVESAYVDMENVQNMDAAPPRREKLDGPLVQLKLAMEKGWKPSASDKTVPDSVLKSSSSPSELRKIRFENGRIRAIVEMRGSDVENAERICTEAGLKVIKAGKKDGRIRIEASGEPSAFFEVAKIRRVISVRIAAGGCASIWNGVLAFIGGLWFLRKV